MKFNNLRIMALTALSATAFYATAADAQTVTVPASATVANTITVVTAAPLEYGTLIAINEAANTASIAINTQDTLGTPASTGGNAKIIATAGTPTSAQIDVTGVSGNAMELQISNVVNPTDGTDTLSLGSFVYSVDGGTTETPIALDTVFTLTANGAAQPVEIGATLTTPAQAALIGDGTYNGSFDFIASY